MLTPKKLNEINKTPQDLIDLNALLKEHHIDIAYIPRKGWRAFRVSQPSDPPNAPTTTIRWMEPDVLLNWFNQPQQMILEFLAASKKL